MDFKVSFSGNAECELQKAPANISRHSGAPKPHMPSAENGSIPHMLLRRQIGQVFQTERIIRYLEIGLEQDLDVFLLTYTAENYQLQKLTEEYKQLRQNAKKINVSNLLFLYKESQRIFEVIMDACGYKNGLLMQIALDRLEGLYKGKLKFYCNFGKDPNWPEDLYEKLKELTRQVCVTQASLGMKIEDNKARYRRAVEDLESI